MVEGGELRGEADLLEREELFCEASEGGGEQMFEQRGGMKKKRNIRKKKEIKQMVLVTKSCNNVENDQ